jgi:hypothetical protein
VPDDLASSNVNRSYSLAASSLTIFTFTLVFLYPRVATGEVDGTLFQATLILMGVATFAFAIAAFHYYGASLGRQIEPAQRVVLGRRGDRLWVLGYALLFLAPSLILFAVSLVLVGSIWLVLWLGFGVFTVRNFPRVQTIVDEIRRQ